MKKTISRIQDLFKSEDNRRRLGQVLLIMLAGLTLYIAFSQQEPVGAIYW